MLFTRFYDDQLAQASYLIGCGASGTAVVVDPNRRTDEYIASAEAAGLRVTAVTETHIQPDYVSGPRALAARPRRRKRLRKAHERGAPVHCRVRAPLQLGLRGHRRIRVRPARAPRPAGAAPVFRRDEAPQSLRASGARRPGPPRARGGAPDPE